MHARAVPVLRGRRRRRFPLAQSRRGARLRAAHRVSLPLEYWGLEDRAGSGLPPLDLQDPNFRSVLTCGRRDGFEAVGSRVIEPSVPPIRPVSYTHLTLPTILRV